MYNPGANPPLMPFGNGNGQSTNPWFTIANQFTPRNLHDVIRWARYIILQSPTTSEVVRKHSTYPITDFKYDTHKDSLRERYKVILKSLRLKEVLQNVGFEYYTLGNSFISVYFPIQRSIICPTCGTSHSAKKANFATFSQYEYRGTCPVCNNKVTFKREDTKSTNVDDMNIIQWTPEHLVINNNPITGEKEFYYKIPNVVKQKIQKGDRLFVDTIPWGFVEATRYNQDFKFDKGQLFHLQNMTTGGTVEGISVPPLLSLFSLVFYQATLRKANEAIAQDYLTPLRVIFPQAQTANSDPVISMSMRNFVANMEGALKKHKQDKNHIVISPTPVGYSPIGGEGRNLLVSQEIQQAEETILLSLGVSKELLSGTTNWTSSSVGLRMLENMLFSYTSRLQELIDWIVKKVAGYLDLEYIDISLLPFKLYDDDTNKQILLQLSQLGKASETTLFNSLGLDFDKEQDNIKDEAISKAKTEIETQYGVEQAQILAAKSTGKEMSGNDETKTLLAKAQDIAEQLYSADEGIRRSFMNKLKIGDYVQWSIVSRLLEEYKKSEEHQGMVQQGVQDVAQGQQDSGAGQPQQGATNGAA